jgi:hypothetical protein
MCLRYDIETVLTIKDLMSYTNFKIIIIHLYFIHLICNSVKFQDTFNRVFVLQTVRDLSCIIQNLRCQFLSSVKTQET